MNEDLISRSALLELYADTEDIHFAVYNVPIPVVRQNILDAPAVDAEKVCEQMGLVKEAFEMAKADLVAVVRCKDCKWFNSVGCAIYIVDESDKPKDNDFCSYGERRADKAVDLDIAASITDLDFEHMTRIAMQQALLRK